MKINGKTISKAKLSDLVNLTPQDIAKLTKRESLTLERRLREATERRVNTLQKQGIRSFAFERYLGGSLPTKATSSDSRQSMQHKIAMYHTFLNAKTSSVTGVKKVWKEQEKRIFRGAPGFKTEEERKRFWAAYEEFMHQNPRFYYESTRIQQFLGEMSFWRKKSFTANDLSELLRKMEDHQLKPGGVDFRADVGYDPDI